MNSARSGVWVRILAEGVAIVVSILLAFGIQAWWEHSNQRSRQLTELGSLLEDFRATRARLEQSLQLHRTIEGAARELDRRLREEMSSSTVRVPDTLIIAVLAMPTLELATGDLQQLQLATDISAIRDAELRQRLVSFPARVQDVTSEEVAGQELVRTRLAPELQRDSDISEAWLALYGWIIDQARGRADSRPTSERSSVSILQSPTTRSLLAERVFHENAAARGIATAIASVDRIIEGLEAYIGGGAL